MADKQVTPFQLTDQFTMDNFNQRINETNTALQNKADLDESGKVPESQLPSLGFNPQIVVTAPTGSTVTCIKDETILTAQEESGTWTFIVPDYGTWVVTSTNGIKTKSKKVLVDVVTQYPVEIDYTDWLYQDGDEYNDVTGGWIANSFSVTATKNEDHFSLVSTGIQYSGGVFTTESKIDLTNYSSIKIEYTFSGTTGKSFFAVRTSQIGDNDTVLSDIVKKVLVSAAGSKSQLTMDVSDLTGSYYVELATRNNADAYSSTFDIYKVWLE